MTRDKQLPGFIRDTLGCQCSDSVLANSSVCSEPGERSLVFRSPCVLMSTVACWSSGVHGYTHRPHRFSSISIRCRKARAGSPGLQSIPLRRGCPFSRDGTRSTHGGFPQSVWPRRPPTSPRGLYLQRVLPCLCGAACITSRPQNRIRRLYNGYSPPYGIVRSRPAANERHSEFNRARSCESRDTILSGDVPSLSWEPGEETTPIRKGQNPQPPKLDSE